MKKLVMAVLITATTIATTVNAQPPAPGRGKGMKAPHGEQLQQVTTFTGSVVKMKVNDDFVYDGFYMLNGSDSMLVKFPAHLGNQVMSAVKIGSTISVNGLLHYPPFGGKEIRMVSSIVNGSIIYDMPPTNPPTPPLETFVSGSGKIITQQTNREGRPIGFILDSKTILRIPPHLGYQLSGLLQNGTTVTYTGMKKQAQDGEVTSANYAIIHCRTINVNGQQYLVGGPGPR